MDGGKVLCFLHCSDFGFIGASPVAWAGCLLGPVSLYSHQDMILECNGPGLKPLSSVAPLYNDVVARLDGGQLARIHLDMLGLERGFLSLAHLERWPVKRMEGFLVGSAQILGLSLFLVLA